MRRANFIGRCPSSRAKRKTFARTQFFSGLTPCGVSSASSALAPRQIAAAETCCFKMTVARPPLASEFSDITAYRADFTLPANFTILQSCIVEPGRLAWQARHFCCSDPRGRWRLLRCGGASRRRRPDRGLRCNGSFPAQAVHRRLGLYCDELPADLAGHHGPTASLTQGSAGRATAQRGPAIRCRKLIPDPETEQGIALDPCTQRAVQFIHWNQGNRADRRERLCCLCSRRRLRPVFPAILQWTGSDCREHRHPPKPATLLLRLKPGGPVV